MILSLLLAACQDTQQTREREAVDRQQAVYQTAQPVPAFDFSLERARIIELYNARMNAAQTWSVWRSMTGMVEGDCPSSGYPLPYGVQLTSPESDQWIGTNGGGHFSTLPQAEPNGLFTNGITSEATWVPCIVDGAIAPMYVEAKVTTYPFPVKVDYDKNRVARDGDVTVTLSK
jgi:hypothetical protein